MKRIVLLTILMLATVAGSALAMTAPTAGFGFELYDIGVNTILKGPVGMVAGIMAVVAAAVLLMRQMIMPAVGTVLAGVFLLTADSFLAAMGALIG